MRELTDKVHMLDQSVHACMENHSYLKEKVRVLEQNPKNGKVWYKG